MRASVTALGAAIVLVALPTTTHAQTGTTTRGAFGGAVSSDATVGTFRGNVSQGTTLGAGRGAVSSDTVIGAIGNGPPVSFGGYGTPGPIVNAPALRVPAGGLTLFNAQFARWGASPYRGDASPGSVGAFGRPAPSGTELGSAGLQELEGRLKSAAAMSMWDGNYKQGEALLNRSVTIREEIAGGADKPEVASALEDNAKYLREWSRDDAAADMETRAKEIRTKLEPSPAPTRSENAERVGRAVLMNGF